MILWHTGMDNGFVLLKTGDLNSRVSHFNPELIFPLFCALAYITTIKRAEVTKIRFPEDRVQENDVFCGKSVQQRLNKTWLIISVFFLTASSNCLLLKSSAFANLKLICPKMKQNIWEKNPSEYWLKFPKLYTRVSPATASGNSD